MVDIFYKPPLQRADECKALEENYMNCMVQKSLKDRVLANKCVLDSILWFHTECPKAAAAFDDPMEFKRKFRNFFAMTKASADIMMSQSDEEKRMHEEYAHVAYPEDIKEKKQFRQFPDEFKHLNPVYHPESEDDWETEVTNEIDEEDPVSEREFGKPSNILPPSDLKHINIDEASKFSSTRFWENTPSVFYLLII